MMFLKGCNDYTWFLQILQVSNLYKFTFGFLCFYEKSQKPAKNRGPQRRKSPKFGAIWQKPAEFAEAGNPRRKRMFCIFCRFILQKRNVDLHQYTGKFPVKEIPPAAKSGGRLPFLVQLSREATLSIEIHYNKGGVPVTLEDDVAA